MNRKSVLLIVLAISVARPLSAQESAPLPLFDAHIHYSVGAPAQYSPEAAIAILERAGIRQALLSSTPNEGTVELYSLYPQRFIPQLRPYRITRDFETWALERAEGGRVRLSELAERIVLSRSNMTRLIDRLEQAGLVGRERSEEDGRGSYAILTPAGKAQRAKMWPVYKAAISTLFETHLQPAEARVMNLVLRRILVAARG